MMRRRSIQRLALLLLVGVILLGYPPSAVVAQQAQQSDDRPPIAYRRIFVPAADQSTWPLAGEKFLPIDAREFQARAAAANREVLGRNSAVATITDAIYSAQFENGQLIGGRGEWRVALRDAPSSLLPLGELSLVIQEPRWRDDSALAARLGLWGKRDAAADTFGLEVPESGTLDFTWHVAARKTRDGVEFPWRLPVATSTRFLLDLPEGMEPVLDGALHVDPTDAMREADPTETGMRRWVLAIRPMPQATLRIRDARRPNVAVEPSASFADEMAYRITERGLELTATLRFDSPNGQREMSVPLPSGLKLTSAQANGRELDWFIAEADSLEATRAVIQLPDALRDGPAVVELHAWQELILDRTWQLPKLQPQSADWNSGTASLAIDAALELRGLVPIDYVQTAAAIAEPTGAESESFTFAAYSSLAELELTIGRARADATVRQGATLTAGDPDITGRLVSRFDVTRGSVHTLEGDVPHGWLVESVETVPSNALREWFIDRQEVGQRLIVQLGRAARPGRAVQVIVQGRLQRTRFSDPLPAKTLGLVAWRNVTKAHNLLLLQTDPSLVAEPTGTLPIVDPNALNDAERSLLAGPTIGPVYDLTRASTDASLRLAAERPQFDAEVTLDARLTGQGLRQSLRLTLRQQSGRADRVLVFSTAPLAENVRWTNKTTAAPLVAERLLADHPQRARLPTSGELWQLQIPRAGLEPIEIAADWTSPWPSKSAVPLLSLPGANVQRGRLFIRAEPGIAVDLEPARLQRASLPAQSDENGLFADTQPVRAAYRYEPAECELVARQPQLLLESKPADSGANLLVVQRLDLESVYAPGGVAAHRATYLVENHGAASLQLILAEGVRLELAEIDGRPVVQPAEPNHSTLEIPLPRDRQSVLVRLILAGAGRPLAVGRMLQFPVADGESPPLTGEWTIRLPEEFALMDAGGRWAYGTFDWRRRLFGPLAGRKPLGVFIATMAAGSDRSTRDTRLHTLDTAGWGISRIPFVARGPRPVLMTHGPTTTAWSLSLFLLCLIAGWKLRRRRELFALLIGAAAGLCLLLPDLFAPLATGIFLGLLSSLLIPSRRPTVDEDAPTKTWRIMTTTTATAVTWLALFCSLAPGQEAEDAELTAARIHRVLIPIDGDGQVVGDKFYVGEKLLQELLRLSADPNIDNHDWILSKAAYQMQLDERPDRPGLGAARCSMSFEIETLSRDAVIELPLAREEAEWTDAKLDGISRELAWRDNGQGATLAIGEPGRYQLTVGFIPDIRDVVGERRISLTLPRVSGATLQLARPPALTGLTVSGMTDLTPDAGSADSWTGKLDGTGRLVIQWPRQDAWTADAQNLRVVELRWLHLTDEGVVLDVKYVIEGAHRPAGLTLFADRDWQLLNEGDSAMELHVESDSSGRQSIQVPLPTDLDQRCEAALRFRLNGATLPGNLRLPPIDTASLPVAGRWLAVSNGPDWDCEIAGNGTTTKPIDEFLAAWSGRNAASRGNGDTATPSVSTGSAAGGDAAARVSARPGNAPGVAVFAENSAGARWRVAVRPRRAESTIDESIQVAAGMERLRIQFRAEVTPGVAHQFQLPIRVPAQLSIDQFSLIRGGASLAIRWVRKSEHEVQVFFAERASAPYRLLLTGSTPLDAAGSSNLPNVAIAGRSAAPPRLTLYREENVLVDMSGVANTPAGNNRPNESPPPGWNARPVGSYQLASDTAENARLTILPNILETGGETLTTLTQQGGRWWAGWKGRLTVRRGTLDTLRLQVPSTWAGPFEVTPTATVEFTPRGNHTATLAVRLPNSLPTGSAFELEIRGPLMPVEGGRIEVPNITSAAASNWQRFVTLPAIENSGPIAWTFDGVGAKQPPAHLQPQAIAPPDDSLPTLPTRSFLVTADPFRVAQATTPSDDPAAAVRLADTVVLEGIADGAVYVTRFVVVTSGTSPYTLHLPDGQQLADIYLDGQPLLARRLEAGRWTVPLGQPRLPQILVVVTRSVAVDRAFGRHELRRPTLFTDQVPLPVELSLWSIGRPTGAAPPDVEGAMTVAAAEHSVLRLDRSISIVEAATPTATALPKPESGGWFRFWAAHFSAMRQPAAAASTPSNVGQELSLVPATAEERQAEVWNRIDAWTQLSGESESAGESDQLQNGPDKAADRPTDPLRLIAALPPRLADSNYKWTYCVADGAADQLTVGRLRASASFGRGRAIGLLTIVGLTALSFWFVRQPRKRGNPLLEESDGPPLAE